MRSSLFLAISHFSLLTSHGWTQERIAKAKGLKDTTWVSRRLKFHNLPNKIKNFLRQDIIAEGHLAEISSLCVDAKLEDWLTPSQAWEELAQTPSVWGLRGKNQ